MRGRWKSMLSESFVQIAVILSLLRTDLRVYLRQYSGYPEVQQVLLGQSVGLHLADHYHNNDLLPLPLSKYIDENDYIMNEVNRLIRSPRLPLHHTETHIISAWLVNNDTAHSSTSPDPAASASGYSQTEPSQQDVEIIEQLLKEDMDMWKGLDAFAANPKEQYDVTGEDSIIDEDTGNRVAIQQAFYQDENYIFLPLEQQQPPAYNTQSSLEMALQGLDPYGAGGPDLSMDEMTMLYPQEQPAHTYAPWESSAETNNPGLLWGNSQTFEPYQASTVDSNLSPGSADSEFDFDATMGTENNFYGIFEPQNVNPSGNPTSLDMEIDTDALLSDAGLYSLRDSISEDSAVSLGNSPQHSWWESERDSASSDDFDLEDGAVGYTECKREPSDFGFYDYESQPRQSKYEKNVVTHDHTYGAPHGGVPHVRKMDIKTEKVPSRGLVHDEAMCRKMKIPFTVDAIINSPMDEFNALLENHELNSKQTTLVKDIRRRGKNKVAAQNCRQKKNGELSGLEEEVEALRSKRNSLHQRKTILLNKTTETRKHIDIMSAEIFNTLRDENGVPYDTSRFSLEVGRDGEIQVTSTEQTRRCRNSRKRDSSKRRKR